MDLHKFSAEDLLSYWISEEVYEVVIECFGGVESANMDPILSDKIKWAPATETVFTFQFEHTIKINDVDTIQKKKLVSKFKPSKIYGIGKEFVDQCFLRNIVMDNRVLKSIRNMLGKLGHEMVKTPNYYFQGFREEDCAILLIHEDVRQEDFTLYDYRTPLTFEAASLVIKQYATLHAGYDLTKNKINTDQKNMNEKQNSELKNFTVNIHSQMLESHALLLENVKGHENTSKWIRSITESIAKRYLDTYKPDQRFHTLSLSCLMGNMFHFRNNQTEMCLSSFSGARLSTPSFDINNLLFICLDSNVRRNRSSDLISVYYDRYKEIIEDKIPVDFTLNELKNHVRDTTLVAWFAMLQIFPSFIGGSQFNLDMSKFNELCILDYIESYRDNLQSLLDNDPIFKQRLLDAYSDIKYLVY